jgi:hypothetical protein
MAAGRDDTRFATLAAMIWIKIGPNDFARRASSSAALRALMVRPSRMASGAMERQQAARAEAKDRARATGPARAATTNGRERGMRAPAR